MVANNLLLSTTNRWCGAQIVVDLSQGSVVNVPGGVDTAPPVSLPSLEFDTYVGRIGELTAGMGGAVELGGGVFDLSGPTSISAAWARVMSGSGGAITNSSIGQFVFSDDAVGTWSLGVLETGAYQVKYLGGTIQDGVLRADFNPGDINLDNYVGLEDLDFILDYWNTIPGTHPTVYPPLGDYIGLEALDVVLNNWNAGEQQIPWDLPQDLPGDLNGDGFVALDDLDIILSNNFQYVTPGDLLSGDASGDGFVGLDDYNIVYGNWNHGSPPIAVVPEPASLSLLVPGLLTAMKRRDKRS